MIVAIIVTAVALGPSDVPGLRATALDPIVARRFIRSA
jgi:hypothetical protein